MKKEDYKKEFELQQIEVDQNYKMFNEKLSGLLLTHYGKYALISSQEILSIFDTIDDCYTAAKLCIPGKRFSIQKITDEVIDMRHKPHLFPPKKNKNDVCD